MKMDNYDGPTVAVVVRNNMAVFGIATTEVVSVHRDRDQAARALADEILAGNTTGQGLAVIDVPAPFLDEPSAVTGPAEHRADDLEAIAYTIDRNLPGSSTVGHDRAMPAARAVLKVVAQRMADARSIAAQDEPSAVTGHGSPVRELDPAASANAEWLEDAARVVAGGQRTAPMTPGAWASYDGDLQEQWTEFAARIVTAYLQGERNPEA